MEGIGAHMTDALRTRNDYEARGVEAARRVLVDLGQTLGSMFEIAIVVIGGWVPELLLHDAEEPHTGSLDVDLALDPCLEGLARRRGRGFAGEVGRRGPLILYGLTGMSRVMLNAPPSP